MKGWFVANGYSDTPDCLDKFIRSWRISGYSGGSDCAINVSHTHGVECQGAGEHQHDIRCMNGTGAYRRILADVELGTYMREQVSEPAGQHAHEVEVYNAGFSGIDKNMPAYINSIPIIRMS